MDILAELKAERGQIEEAILSLERLARGRHRGPGRPPNMLADFSQTPPPKRRRRSSGSNDPGSQPPPAAPAAARIASRLDRAVAGSGQHRESPKRAEQYGRGKDSC
jgi:hypothetical protein